MICISSAPSPPESVKVNAINSTAIHVKWKPPLYPNGPLKLYTVLYDRTQYFISSNARKESVMPNVTELAIGGLAPFKNYTVKVKVENSLIGKESKAVTVVTKAAGNNNDSANENNSIVFEVGRLQSLYRLELRLYETTLIE